MEKAKAHFDSTLRPAFERYRSDAVSLFAFNANEGKSRADRLIHLAQWTPYVLAAFCVILLMTGVFVGFKASLGAFSVGWKPDPAKESRGARPT